MVLGEPPGEGPAIPSHWEFAGRDQKGFRVLDVKENAGFISYHRSYLYGNNQVGIEYCEDIFNSNGKSIASLKITENHGIARLLREDDFVEVEFGATNPLEDQFSVDVKIGEPVVGRFGRVITPATTLITYGYNLDERVSGQYGRGIMKLVLRSREPRQTPKTTTHLSVSPTDGESTDPTTYDLNIEEGGMGLSDAEKQWRRDNFDVTLSGDRDGLKVTEVNRKTGEVRTVECPTIINIESVKMAFAKSTVDAATAGLKSPWRELDQIIPVKLSGIHPLPPPKPPVDLEPTTD